MRTAKQHLTGLKTSLSIYSNNKKIKKEKLAKEGVTMNAGNYQIGNLIHEGDYYDHVNKHDYDFNFYKKI